MRRTGELMRRERRRGERMGECRACALMRWREKGKDGREA